MSHTNWGGERVGAGRPVEQKTLQAQKMRERLIELCSERAEEIFDALLTAAIGRYEIKTGAGGDSRVYTKAPDVSALREICDRALGKPTNTVALDVEYPVPILTCYASHGDVHKNT